MKKISLILTAIVLMLLSYSCGVDGDPGHCYFSVDWEYYDADYGVYYYEDDNPDVPEGMNLESKIWYDSYPGTYNYYYESEDYEYWYSYEGTYTLIQELGTSARLFEDGMDGLDTYMDLYLYIYARKSLNVDAQAPESKRMEDLSKDFTNEVPLRIEEFSWEEAKDGWKIIVDQTVKVYEKK